MFNTFMQVNKSIMPAVEAGGAGAAPAWQKNWGRGISYVKIPVAVVYMKPKSRSGGQLATLMVYHLRTDERPVTVKLPYDVAEKLLEKGVVIRQLKNGYVVKLPPAALAYLVLHMDREVKQKITAYIDDRIRFAYLTDRHISGLILTRVYDALRAYTDDAGYAVARAYIRAWLNSRRYVVQANGYQDAALVAEKAPQLVRKTERGYVVVTPPWML
jgi:hypothetical protein